MFGVPRQLELTTSTTFWRRGMSTRMCDEQDFLATGIVFIFFLVCLSVSNLTVHSELTTTSSIYWMSVMWILERIPPHGNPTQKIQVSLVFWCSIWFQRWEWFFPCSQLQHIYPLWFPSSTWRRSSTFPSSTLWVPETGEGHLECESDKVRMFITIQGGEPLENYLLFFENETC